MVFPCTCLAVQVLLLLYSEFNNVPNTKCAAPDFRLFFVVVCILFWFFVWLFKLLLPLGDPEGFN